MSAAPLVEVRDLRVGYPTRRSWALDGVDLDVTEGEQLLVVGASGSGKSSLLHALSGLLPRAIDADLEGSVRVADRHVLNADLPSLFGTVGLLRQDPASQVALPIVEDELAFVLENRATAPEAISAAVDHALDHVGLRHLRRRRTSTLSGGELQRVALAATLLAEPRLLVLDEPTAMLDPTAARQVGDLLLDPRIVGPRTATVIVEHRLEALATLPGKVLLVDADGRVRRHGPTPEVLADEARWLVDTGAWLPLAVELGLATAGRVDPHDVAAGPTFSAPVEASLRRIAGRTDLVRPTSGSVLLRTDAAAFSPPGVEVPLVGGVDVHVRAGDVIAVIGANGSGKTSLLLGLAGQLPCVGGTTTSGSVGVVFQHPEHQFVGRTVAGDVAASLGRGRRRPSVSDPRVTRTLSRFSLDALADADPFRLSGGQKRRLSVAAMAVAGHAVLCLDEPTFGLDRATSQAVASELTALARDGRGVVFSTHDLRLAASVADRVLVMQDGRVVRDGRPEDVLADTRTLATAGLRRPALLDWWTEAARDVSLRGLLTGLDRALSPATVGARP